MKHYHIRQDENKKCDDCGGETWIQRFREGIGWERIGPVSFAAQPNLEFLKRFRRWCPKCGKPLRIKYEILGNEA